MKKNVINNFIKIILIIFVASLLFSTFSTSFAGAGKIDTSNSDSLITDTDDSNELLSIGGHIVGFFQWVGSAVAIIVIGVIGVKYLMGSAEEKAEYKKTAIYYMIGAFLVFSTTNILAVIYNVLNP